MPPLVGPRLLLRAMHSSDITPQHVAWLNDPQVVQFSNQRFFTHTLDSCLRYQQGFEGSASLYASVRLVSGVSSGSSGSGSDRAIGTLTAYRSLPHGTADIGILLGDRKCWGRGLGLEAFTLLADWLATLPGTRKLTCGTLACNHGMVALAQRAGFVQEAVRVGQECVHGRAVDLLHFARFATTGSTAPPPVKALKDLKGLKAPADVARP